MPARRFVPPPGWPEFPAGWEPPAGWTPDPSWPPAPQGWNFYPDDGPATTVLDPVPAGADPATAVFAPVPGAPTEPPTPGEPEASSGRPPWLLPAIVGAVALVVGLLLGMAVSSSASENDDTGSGDDPVPAATETVTTTHTVTAEPTPSESLSISEEQAALDKRAAELDDREAALDQREAQQDTREKAQDAREADLDAREEAIVEKEKPEERQTIDGTGTYFVGIDILAGSWTTDGGDGCTWERLSSIDGDEDSVIDSGDASDGATVEVLDSDIAFHTVDCSEWTLEN